MKISLNILLSELGLPIEANMDELKELSFESVQMLTSKKTNSTNNVLFISTLSDALDIVDAIDADERYCLVVRDRIVDSKETYERMKNLIVLNENISVDDLLNTVVNIFLKINNWLLEMQMAIVECKNMQDLLSLSEDIIGNHIDVIDASFKLIAHTENISTDDEVTSRLVERGYHDSEILERMEESNRIDEFINNKGLIISNDNAMSNYTVVKYIFRWRDAYSVLVVMVCSDKECSRGLIDLFMLLIENLKVFVDKDYPRFGNNPKYGLFVEMLKNDNMPKREVQERLDNLGMSRTGRFDVYVLSLKEDENKSLSAIISNWSNTFENSIFVDYCGEILAINSYESESDIGLLQKEFEEKLNPSLASMAISVEFDDLFDLSTAYMQAKNALIIGRSIEEKMNEIESSDMKCYYFNDLVVSYMLKGIYDEKYEIIKNCFVFKVIDKLIEYNKRNSGFSRIELLDIYLNTSLSASETADVLHMHRNTVIYHIEKMEEFLDIDISDAETRLQLMLAIKAYKMGLY